MTRHRSPIAAWAGVLLLAAAPLAHAAAYKATLLVRDDDPRLARNRVERLYPGQPGGPAIDGLKVALDEAKFELESVGVSVAVDLLAAGNAQAARDAAAKAEKAGAAALVADLPADWLLAAADAVKLPVLNIGEPADRLREKDCRPRLWHVMPSERMRADALAQWLVSRKWAQVLMLVGPGAADSERSAVAQASIKRYGLKLAGSKPFKLSADPRERDLANPLLLTQGSYDAVWVVDSDGEFARSLPYRTVLPRPVVGDGGLTALAWAAQFERFGAPQIVRRFDKAAHRPMTAHDWTSWFAGKALVTAAVAQPKGPAAAFAKTLVEQEIDGYKGVTLSFRPWDGQLRQPMMLTDGVGVIGTAPIDGLLHPKNNLDTLGADAPEKLCKRN